jgi:hypothetical protein
MAENDREDSPAEPFPLSLTPECAEIFQAID